MRRNTGLVLAGLGAFLLVAAFMVRIYAYPRVAVAPIDQNSITKLEAKNATLFDSDPSVLKDITTDLSVTSRTVGDVKATKAQGGDTLVWVDTTSVRSADGKIRSRSIEKAAQNEHTGEAVNCCGNFTESEEGKQVPVTREGLVYKFPFNTQKKTYKFWDSTLGKATDAKYVKTTRIRGMKVYEFVQDIPKTKVGTQDLPKSVIGITGAGNVTADSMYQNKRTQWVEPVTGAVIDRSDNQVSSFEYGGKSLIATKADIKFTDAQVKDMVDQIGTKATLLSLTRGITPVLVGLLGLLLMLGGILVQRRGAPAATRAPVREDAPTAKV